MHWFKMKFGKISTMPASSMGVWMTDVANRVEIKTFLVEWSDLYYQ